MKKHCYLWITILALSGCLQLPKNKDVLFQASTINALLEGVYDGELSYRELMQRGDFGIGTFNGLDGEMLAVDGGFYQIKSDGKAYPVDGALKTPFAAVTFFEADKAIVLDQPLDYDALQQYLDSLWATKNIFYAIKITGVFDYIKTRSVPRQEKPYPPLVEVARQQPTFEFHNTAGVLVGYRLPAYMKGVNVSGYHFHFINKDRTAGGHVLECRLKGVMVEVDYTLELHMLLPEGGEFYKADLSKDKQKELKSIER